MALQNLRSGVANKRPIPTIMSEGQIALNTNEASPGLFFKDSNGDLVKVGPVHIGTSAPNSSPASTAATALVTGATYQILTVGTSDFTSVGASANTVGVVFTATGTTTGTGTVSGQQGVEKGEQWLDTTGGNYVLKIYDGTAWRSEAGEFVNVSGDTMTGALLLDNAASASAPDLSFDGDANTGVYSPGADQLALATNGTQRVIVDGNGNVGIGGNGTGTSLGVYLQKGGGASAHFYEASDGTKKMIAGADSGQDFVKIGSLSSHPVGLVAGNGEKLRITTDGKVGVGTSSPAGLLDLAGTKTTASNIGQLNVRDTASFATGVGGSIYFFGKYRNLGDYTPAGFINTKKDNSTEGNYSFSMGFGTIANGGSISEKMTLTSGGSLGIGTTSPSHKLTIGSSTDADLFFMQSTGSANNTSLRFGISGNDAEIHGSGGSSGNLVFKTYGNERMRIDSSGNVGVGTSSPGAKLEVAGDALFAGGFDSSSTTTNGLKIDSNGAIFNQRTNTISTLFGGYYQNSQTVKITADGSATFAGNVGIGTTTVDELLHIEQSVGNYGPAFKISNSNASRWGGKLVFESFNSTTPYEAAVIKADGGSATSSGNLIFETAGSERMRIDSSGNVGIGTSTTVGKMTVKIDTNKHISFNGAQGEVGNVPALVAHQDNGSLQSIGMRGVDLRFATSSAERMRIDSSGRVGIGATSPGSFDSAANQLVIQNSGSCGITIDATSGTDSNIYFADGPDGNEAYRGVITYSHSVDAMRFGTNGGSEKMRIDSSGRLLIGTSSAPAGTDAQYTKFAIRGNTLNDNASYLSLGNNKTTANTGSSDNLGIITFNDNDSDAGEYARITGATDGTNGTDDYPGTLIFSTTADGASSPTERMRIESGGATKFSGTIAPATDNTHNVGGASLRWSTIYAATGTINTSDANLKQDIENLDAAELSVAVAIKGLIKKFRFIDAFANKGDGARIHVGVIAQEVEQAFVDEGLDPRRYALFCEDDMEDGTKRLGIRYDELLAFVVAAL